MTMQAELHLTSNSLPQHYQAIIYYAPGDIRLEKVEQPELLAGEVLIKIEKAATNGTDLKAFLRGHPVLLKTLPSYFGHEAVGHIVAKADDVMQFEIGDRVVPANSAPCGDCVYCNKQQFTLCENLELLNGTYAQFLKIPAIIVEKNLYKVPLDIAAEKLLPVESLAVCLRGIDQLKLEGDESVLVLGAGPIASLLAKVSKFRGCHVSIMGRNLEKLKQAQLFSNADEILEYQNEYQSHESVKKEIVRKDIVIEATGSPEVWGQAINYVAPGGKVLYFGGCPVGSQFTLPTAPIHYQEITLLGAFHHTPKHFKQAVDWVIEGKIDLSGFVTHELPLADLEKAFELMQAGVAQKVAITCQ